MNVDDLFFIIKQLHSAGSCLEINGDIVAFVDTDMKVIFIGRRHWNANGRLQRGRPHVATSSRRTACLAMPIFDLIRMAILPASTIRRATISLPKPPLSPRRAFSTAPVKPPSSQSPPPSQYHKQASSHACDSSCKVLSAMAPQLPSRRSCRQRPRDPDEHFEGTPSFPYDRHAEPGCRSLQSSQQEFTL